MNKSLAAVLVLVLILAGVLWLGMRDAPREANEATDDLAAADTAFEARDVVLRQMDASGRLQYEVEATRIEQQAGNDTIVAKELTLRHDPAGTAIGSERRWVVTAAEGQLPAGGGILTLSGGVQGAGRLPGRSSPLRFDTDELTYDLQKEQIDAAGAVEVRMGCVRVAGQSLNVNVATGEHALKYGRARLSRCNPGP